MNNLASRLTQRITIEEPNEVSDGAGGYSISWSAVDTVWAEIVPSRGVNGKERLADAQLQSINKYKITIRYINNINQKMRVVWGAKTFNIRAVIDPDQHQERLEIIAEEGVAV